MAFEPAHAAAGQAGPHGTGDIREVRSHPIPIDVFDLGAIDVKTRAEQAVGIVEPLPRAQLANGLRKLRVEFFDDEGDLILVGPARTEAYGQQIGRCSGTKDDNGRNTCEAEEAVLSSTRASDDTQAEEQHETNQ